MIRLELKNCSMILMEKQQKYLTGNEILNFNQRQIIEQIKFAYSPLGRSFGKQTKTIEDQEKNK